MRKSQIFAGFLLLSYLSGCTKWEVPSVTPQQALSDSAYIRRGVRITTAAGDRRMEIRHPRLVSDTLRGIKRDSTAAAIPLLLIRELEVKRPDGGATGALVVFSVAGAAALTALVICIALCGAST